MLISKTFITQRVQTQLYAKNSKIWLIRRQDSYRAGTDIVWDYQEMLTDNRSMGRREVQELVPYHHRDAWIINNLMELVKVQDHDHHLHQDMNDDICLQTFYFCFRISSKIIFTIIINCKIILHLNA